MGSLQAFEWLAEHLPADRFTVFGDRRTRFRFGNGSKGESMSEVQLDHQIGGQPVKISMACLETPTYVPLLGSIKLLRKLGAVIDFAKDTMTTYWGKVKLERTSSGHLVLDLMQDVLLGSSGGAPTL